MAKQAKKISKNPPRNRPLLYTTDSELAERYYRMILISEDQFNNVATFLETNHHSAETLTLYRKIGRDEFEPAAFSYQYKGCKIKVQEPVFWDSKDEPCLAILPFKGCCIDKIVKELGLSPTLPLQTKRVSQE